MGKKKANDWMSQSQKTPIKDYGKTPKLKTKDIVMVFLTKHFIPTPHQVTHNQRLI